MKKTETRKERLNKRNYANSVSGNHSGTFDIGRNNNYICARRKWNNKYGTKSSRCNK